VTITLSHQALIPTRWPPARAIPAPLDWLAARVAVGAIDWILW